MSQTVKIPTGVSASGNTTAIWNNLQVRQSILNSDNPNYLRTFQVNNNMLVLFRANFIAGIQLEDLIPLLIALVPQLSWPPVITVQPVNQSVVHPAPANFSITTTSELAGTTYQWQVSSNGGVSFTNLTNGGAYSNVTTATMTVAPPDTSYNQFQYRCLATNASGTSTSAAGILTVT